MAIFTEQEYKSRISALQKELASKQIDIALFSQTTELYYYSGSNLPLYCIIPAQGQPFLIARKGSPRIREECRHMPLEIFGNSKDLIAIFKKHFNNKIKKCGFVLDASSYSTVIRMLKLLDKPEAVDISWDTKMLRTIKSESEIAIQRKAGVIISKIPEVIRNNYHPGITELELSAHIEFYLRVNGAGSLNCRQESIVLAPGVLSAGINSLVPNKFDGICSGAGLSNALPFGGNDECIPPNTSIICDYGFVLEGYHVDMTRMFSVANPPEEALKAMDAMLSVEKL
ncbi:MAG: aminopeptidase P family protein, partial [Spirochaetes bacterium]|nr:aminopeptidase P family protein [Spirochaetota bacterium]